MSEERAERIIACVSAAPGNEDIIRTADKLAGAFRERFVVLHVGSALEAAKPDQVQSDRQLAERLGARYMSVSGTDPAVQIAEYARQSGTARIVMGRPRHRRFRLPWSSTVTQRLLQIAPDLDIYLVPQPENLSYTPLRPDRLSLASCLVTLALLAAATLLSLILSAAGVTEANIITLFILSVLFISYLTDGYQYGIFASIASVLIFNFLFTEPRYTFFAYETGYPLTFVVMGIAAILTSSLTIRQREEERIIAQKAYRTDILLAASRNLQHSETRSAILRETASQICKLTGTHVLLYPVVDGRLEKPLVQYAASASEEPDDTALFASERPAAEWALLNRCAGGAGTKFQPELKHWYAPIYGSTVIVAIAGIGEGPFKKSGEPDKDLLLALLGECGSAIEREQLRESQNQLAIEAQREKTRSNLLRAISHDLRTPLTSISGNSEVLLREAGRLSEDQRRSLYQDINSDAVWLIGGVENILLTTRMDNKTLTLSLQPESIQDLIDESVSHMFHLLGGHQLIVEPQPEFLMANVEASLMIQVISNLIDNAVKYSPAEEPIRIAQKAENGRILISIRDGGPGISEEAMSHLFTMFYTAGNPRSDSRRGLGLGLSLCKAIVEAHNGTIRAENCRPHGAMFTISLPQIKEELKNE